jgi:YesN/AraC family two-component response regulator
LIRKVLIIDDEKPTLAMFELFLQAYGFEVLTAEKGEEGIAVFETENPSIVFTDIKMPGMDGFEVLKRIKTISPGAVVVMITGHGDRELEKKALDFNATDFIHKPVQKEALDAALEKAEKLLNSGTF